MTSILLFCCCVALVDIGLCCVFKKTFGQLLAPTLFAISLLEYFLVCICHNIFISLVIVYVIGFVFGMAALISIIRKSNIVSFIKKYCIQGLIAFLLVCIFCILVSNFLSSQLYQWDEYSHWGPLLKSLLATKDFYITEASTAYVHVDYPPIVSLVEINGCIFEGEFCVSNCKTILLLLQFSVFFGLIKEGSKCVSSKTNSLINIIKILLIILIFTLISRTPSSFFVISLYQDSILGFVAGYVLFSSLKYEGKFNCFVNCVSIAFLALIKQSALIFILIVLVSLLIRCIYSSVKYKFKNQKSSWISFILITLSVVIAFVSWKVVYSASYAGENFVPQFNDNVSSVVKSLSSGITQDQFYVFSNFISAFLSKSMISRLYVPLGLILIVYLIVLTILKCKIKKPQLTWNCVLTITGAIFLYSAFMVYVYMFQFSGTESTELASFERYMGTMLIVCFTYLILILDICFKHEYAQRHIKISIAVCVLLAICLPIELSFWNTDNKVSPYKEEIDNASKISDEIANNVNTNVSNILVIDSNMTQFGTHAVSYFCDKYNMTFINQADNSFQGKYALFGEYPKHRAEHVNDTSWMVKCAVEPQQYIQTYYVPENIKAIFKTEYGVDLDNNSAYKVDLQNNEINKIS